MIVRTWRAYAATAENADAYVRHLEGSVFPRLRGIAGHHSAHLLRRAADDRVELLVLTWWESMQAVRAFAGEAPENAVVEPEARAVLAEFDPTVRHYEVVLGPAR